MVSFVSCYLVQSDWRFEVSFNAITKLVHLTQVKVAVCSDAQVQALFIFISQSYALLEHLCSFVELKLTLGFWSLIWLVLESHLEVQVTQIVHCLHMAFVFALRVKFERLVPILLNSTAEFITDSQVGDCSSVSSFWSFVEPAECLFELLGLVEEKTAKCVHALDMSVCSSWLVVADSLRQVLFDYSVSKLVVLPYFEESFFKRIFLLDIPLVLGFLEVLEC